MHLLEHFWHCIHMVYLDIKTTEKFHTHISLADLCNNCAFDDKSMKLGTIVHHRLLQIFGYRAI